MRGLNETMHATELHEIPTGQLSEITRNQTIRRLKHGVFPFIGSTPLTEIKSRLIIEKVLRPIEDRDAITADSDKEPMLYKIGSADVTTWDIP